MRVAIIGAGLIGRSWAVVFARAGFEVALQDASAEVAQHAQAFVAANVPDSAGRVRLAASIADALDGAELVQESTPETLAAKRAIFPELDRLAMPDALLASSTSGIVASQFTETLAGRARCFVAHPVNPPHLVPLVELVGAPWTAPAAIERAKAIYAQVGQVPIVLNREIDGFVLNRLQAVLLAEAFRLVGEGIASPEDVDKAVKDGLGLRWSFMGPFETIELNAPDGIRDYCRRYGPTMAHLSNASPDPFGGPTLEAIMSQWPALPDRAAVAARMRWRDLRLAALHRHKSEQSTR